MSPAVEPDVLAVEEGVLGHLTLNRPRAINALTLGMVRAIDAALDRWQDDPAIACVLLDGAGGRGLCAGGDIVTLQEAAKSGEHRPAEEFWREEYHLNARIACYPKPFVVLMDGIVMGGGVGLSAHASHRLATASLTIAMPEVGIGFAPDVGGTWLLSRAPGEIGAHLALTGARIGVDDALLCGLADRLIDAEAAAALAGRLAAGGLEAVMAGLGAPRGSAAPLAAARGWIDDCYGADEVEEILARLRARPEEEARRAAATIEGMSPTSLKVTRRALREARGLPDLRTCLEHEYRISCAFLDSHDFVEGVRAAVIDKDREPRWDPATLDRVAAAAVDRFFAPVAVELGLAA
ncbi:MAG TPA: enoyl-CoA hydratase/isomerase family protein [Solirubrobacterales bacterium]|nr:enoyl-CoA hydratase/isomerase family protein [Solirubrobacterales bacterium]